MDPELLKDEIEYIFSTTMDIIFSIHSKRAITRSSSYRPYYIELKEVEVPVYFKADKTSKISSVIPKGIIKVDCDYSIQGLNEDGTYWHVSHFKKDEAFHGFVHNDYLKLKS